MGPRRVDAFVELSLLGRRERKKLEKRAAILASARSLFSEHGFDKTSMDAIAEGADVSVGTVYNTFSNKTDLLLALFDAEIDASAVTAADFSKNSSISLTHVLLDLVRRYMATFEGLERDIVKRITIQALQEGPLGRVGRRYVSIEAHLEDELFSVLEAAVKQGRLRSNVDINGLCRLIFNAANAEYYLWIADNNRTIDEIVEALRPQYDIVLGATSP